MLASKRGKQVDKYQPNYIVFDLETTGISCNYDEVIEISALKVRNGKVIEEFSTLVNPQKSIPARASYVNGITNAMVKNAPVFSQVLPQFMEFIGDDILVGHNIHSFDMKFIWRDAERFMGKVPDNDYIDTLRMARRCLPQLSHHKLVDLAEYYGISSAGAHRALNDCYMNQQVFEKLVHKEKPEIKHKEKVCPSCGRALRVRSGRFGEFWGCSGFPECRYTENINR